MKANNILIGVLAVLLSCTSCLGAERFVKECGAGCSRPSFDGATWETAYRSLVQALDASAAGDTIYVSIGTYRPDVGSSGVPSDNRAASFVMKPDVTVLGGFSVSLQGTEHGLDEVSRPGRSILTGDIGQLGDLVDNSYHMVTAGATCDPTSIIDGFQIVGGNADCIGCTGGGGMIVQGGNPTITNCSFGGVPTNVAPRGGSLYIDSATADVVLENVQIVNGEAWDFFGGGMYCRAATVLLRDCRLGGRVGGKFDCAPLPMVFPVARGGGAYIEANQIEFERVDVGGPDTNGCLAGARLDPALIEGQANAAGLGGGCFFELEEEPRALIIRNSRFQKCATEGLQCGLMCECAGNDGDAGGGFFAHCETIRVDNTIVRSNSCGGAGYGTGGFVDLSSDGAADFANCRFESNLNGVSGGLDIIDGALKRLSHCVFKNNTGVINDLSCQFGLITEIVNCLFDRHLGGGECDSNPLFFSRAVLIADVFGRVSNCTFVGCMPNEPIPFDTGVALHAHGAQSTVTVSNSIFAHYRFTAGSPPVTTSITPICSTAGATIGVTKSDSFPVPVPGAGNINVDPLFAVDCTSLDRRPSRPMRSPVIDAGDNAAIAPDFLDIDGNGQTVGQQIPWDLSHPCSFGGFWNSPLSGIARCQATHVGGCVVDMGAFEATCIADFNLDGLVSVQDIFDFLAAWFGMTVPGDINKDGSWTPQDIFDFLALWFAGCAA